MRESEHIKYQILFRPYVPLTERTTFDHISSSILKGDLALDFLSDKLDSFQIDNLLHVTIDL